MNGEKVIKKNNIVENKFFHNWRARFFNFCSTGCDHFAGARSTLSPFCPRLVLPHKNQVCAPEKTLVQMKLLSLICWQ